MANYAISLCQRFMNDCIFECLRLMALITERTPLHVQKAARLGCVRIVAVCASFFMQCRVDVRLGKPDRFFCMAGSAGLVALLFQNQL